MLHNMNANRKDDLKRAYKEAEVRKGVFKIQSTVTGQTWVDSSATVDTVKNRIWFTLRMGTHPHKKLQQAWNASGPEAMEFAVVEVFPEDTSGYALERLMKDRKQHWLAKLDAEPYK